VKATGRALASALGALAAAGLAGPASAQDAHYWAQQYGTRSELLGGTVVGSPQDLSTTYYNPGGLAFLESPSFLFSALGLEYESYAIDRDDTPSTQFGASRFGAAPSIFTGTFPRSWTESTLAYSFLTRQKLDARIDTWRTIGSDPDAPLANLLIDAKLTENWGGITWSRALGTVGVGATLFGVYRSQRAREEILAQPVPIEGGQLAFATVNEYHYWHTRALAKLGVYWQRGVTSVGLTYTTPGLPLFGSAGAAYYRNIDVPPPESDVDEAFADEDSGVTYRSPMSAAIGARWSRGQWAIYATAEWFDSVDPYRVVTVREDTGAGTGTTLDPLVTQELESVLNLGVGAEFAPRANLTFFGSFVSDHSAADDDPLTGHSLATWDTYQATLGAAFTAISSDFTLGVSVAGGHAPLDLRLDYGGLQGEGRGRVTYRRVKIFLGFEFGGTRIG